MLDLLVQLVAGLVFVGDHARAEQRDPRNFLVVELLPHEAFDAVVLGGLFALDVVEEEDVVPEVVVYVGVVLEAVALVFELREPGLLCAARSCR